MVFKNITYAPGLYKIFDEILVNAADNKVWRTAGGCRGEDLHRFAQAFGQF